MKVFLKIAVIIIVIAGVLIGAAAVLEKNGYLIIGENGIDFNFGEEEASVYIVTYKVDGVEKQLYVEYDSSYSVDPVPKKLGYKFTGFYDAESGGTQFIDASGMSIGRFREKNDITLYAQFVPEKYTIALDYNGGDGSAFGEYSVSYGEKFPELPSYVTVEDKYYLHFAGWMYIDANREPVLITDADGVCDIVFDETLVELLNEDGQFELIAGFETEEYVINFYSKDGQTLLHSETVEYGTHINSIAPKTEDNKVIMKWDKADEDTIAECSTSYYVFTYGYEVTHKIAPSSEKVTVVEENASYRPSTDVSRVGYEFVGWFDGAKDITNSFTIIDSPKTIEARWKAKQYTVTLDANGGTCSVDSKTVTYCESFTLPTPVRDRYMFLGWEYKSSIIDTTQEWDIPDNVVLKAKWTEKDISANLDANGGECELTSINLVLGEKYGTLPVPKKLGYTFGGWACNGSIIDENTVVTSDCTLVANWNMKTRDTFHFGGEVETNASHTLNDIGLKSYFDLEALKAEGYKMKITFKCATKRSGAAIFGLEYDVYMYSKGSEIYHIHEDDTSTSYEVKQYSSSLISLDKVGTAISITISTENIFDMYIKDISVIIEFVKN